MMKKRFSEVPLTPVTSVFIVLIALGTLVALAALHRSYRGHTRAEAARTVLSRGRLMAARLADMAAGAGGEDWARLSATVKALHGIEPGLEYVSVRRGDLIVFHEQAAAWNAGQATGTQTDPGRVRASARPLAIGTNVLPTVVFTAEQTGAGGLPLTVEVAIHRAAVAREELLPGDVALTMLRISMAAVLVAFAVCVLLVAWMMRREERRERQRWEQEHLAFAGAMAGGIAHDFKNPMSSLKLDVQMLAREVKRGGDRTRLADLAGHIEHTMERMEHVFREFLSLAKPAGGRAERVVLQDVLRDAITLLQPRLERRRLTLASNLPAEPLCVHGESVSLYRAFSNLLVNAEEASPDGGRITVTLTPHRHLGILTVDDQGKGIPAADRERVFDMFVTAKPEGTGLGLFLARTAVQRHGGRIDVADAPGGGARLRVELPLVPEPDGRR